MSRNSGRKKKDSSTVSLFCFHRRRLNVLPSCSDTMSTISPTDFDSLEIQQQYNDINNRWDLAAETDWDNENSSARLFERSRIKALAGRLRFRHRACSSIPTPPAISLPDVNNQELVFHLVQGAPSSFILAYYQHFNLFLQKKMTDYQHIAPTQLCSRLRKTF